MADFDWVRARSECSLPKAFERLFAGIQSDVDGRNEISTANSEGLSFEASREGNRILVTRSGPKMRTVKLALNQSSIAVQGDSDGVGFQATPGLNNPGDCMLTVDGIEMELWQVRRMALEKLFFDDLPRPVTVSATRRR